jgi:Dna[CI] antecedent DciA-like protein
MQKFGKLLKAILRAVNVKIFVARHGLWNKKIHCTSIFCIVVFTLIFSFDSTKARIHHSSFIITRIHMENEHSLKEVLQGMVDSLKWKEKLHETKIRQVWNSRMGTTINHYTKEIKLRKGKLFITLTSAPLKQELSYEKEKIQKMMNVELGGQYVKSVIVR